MDPLYSVRDTAEIYSPALLFYKEAIKKNIATMIQLAGSPKRLRPHVKTHKTREIVRLELEAGIDKLKCATIAEADMVASCGARDVLLAYPLVGPNCGRMARLMQIHPECRFSALVDDLEAARTLARTMADKGLTLDVLVDIDVGQHRTGIPAGPEAERLYEQVGKLAGLRPAGLHLYDGHNHQESPQEREAAVRQLLEPVLALRARLEKKGLPVPRLVGGGTPTFPAWAKLDLPGLECSPGTCVLHDHGYGTHFTDMTFTPAALLLTRVISRPTPTRLTLDLGYKAVASDPPAGQRCVLLNVPDYKAVLQNEEHLVVETPAADKFPPGSEVYALPQHVCPTCAMHRFAYVVDNNKVTERWEIVARDRVLSV